MSLNNDHLDLIKSFIKHHVKFIIVGGHAAIYYGVNRNTGVLDILIEPTIENGQKLIQALSFLELEIPEIKNEEFTQNLVLSFGLEPDAVDILNFTPGITFKETFNNYIRANYSGLSVPMIDIRDLIKNKESMNRQGEKSYLDKYDVEVLKKILKKKENQ